MGVRDFAYIGEGYKGDLVRPTDKIILVKDLLEIFEEWDDPYHTVRLYLPVGSFRRSNLSYERKSLCWKKQLA